MYTDTILPPKGDEGYIKGSYRYFALRGSAKESELPSLYVRVSKHEFGIAL